MPDIATLFAWFVIAALIGVFVAAIVGLGSLPGKIARNAIIRMPLRSTPLVGLELVGITWPLAFVWAFIPFGDSQTNSTSDCGDMHPSQRGFRDEEDLQSGAVFGSVEIKYLRGWANR